MDLSRIANTNVDGDLPAIVFESADEVPTVLSYAELEHSVCGLAKALSAGPALTGTALKPGDRVAIVAANCWQHFVTYLAIMRAGLVAVPVNYQLSDDALLHILRESEARLAFADTDNAPRIPDGIRVSPIDDREQPGWQPLVDSGAQSEVSLSPVAEDSDALIMYTSGSTGLPKGVPLTHYGYLWSMRQFTELRASLRERASLIAAPLFHMNAQFHVQATLQAGGTAVLMARFDAGRFLELIEEHRVVRITGVPTMLALIIRELESGKQVDLSSVTAIAMGSAPFSKALLDDAERWFPGAAISNGYGTTETGPGIFGAHPNGMPTPALSLGYPLPEVDVKLVGDRAPEHGVLWVRNPMLTRGYLNTTKQRSEAFVDGWYVTNDVMRKDADGFHYYEDRADDMFVCAGENIFPAEVERLLGKHPDVREVAVVPVPDALKGSLPVAFVVARHEVAADAIRTFALQNGPAYAHPRAVYFLDDLPLASTNKVNRHALEKMARQRFQR